MEGVHPSWLPFFELEEKKPYFKELQLFVANERLEHVVYPLPSNVYNAFKSEVLAVKCCILGQDPYHQANQAVGLAFSVPRYQSKTPPSLKNIFKEVRTNYPSVSFETASLMDWANQGVFLLNRVLTVQDSKANSHASKGWEAFTQAAIVYLLEKNPDVVFMLWGKPAQSIKSKIPNTNLILEAHHPSPLSAYRGFFGCNHFKACNAILNKLGKVEIDWSTRL